MHTIRRLRDSLAVARQLPGERRMAFREPERIAELRDHRLRAVVRYAAETVPYYRELFRAERIDPREIRTAADLDRLPLVTKQDVQRDPRRPAEATVAELNRLRPAVIRGCGTYLETLFRTIDAHASACTRPGRSATRAMR